MPRPQKYRRISGYPDYWSFSPDDGTGENVILSLDEYEAIRLIDWLGRTQEETARQMQVARTTVTAIYDSARKKIADALVNGKRILISGGNYCFDDTGLQYSIIQKGSNCMRIAATYENGTVFQHFGHTEQIKLYDVENDAIVKEQVVDTHGQGHGALAGFLKQAAVDILICGGIGGGAKMALAEAGIKLYAGISGNTDEAVKSLIAGNLQQITDATCSHHHGKDHACGEHACGHHEGDQGCREHHGGDHKCGHHN
jgi:predicted DNA-binding protein (UPF0251 family)/predicted Fe-Mo cluster-binding NifX family protein